MHIIYTILWQWEIRRGDDFSQYEAINFVPWEKGGERERERES